MSRNKSFPGARLILSIGSAVGLYRAADELAHEASAPKEPIEPETRSGPDDIKPKILLMIGIGLVLTLWAVVVLIYPLFTFFKYDRTGGKQPSKALQYIPNLPPRPRNVNRPYEVLDTFREREDAELNSYRWVDRSKRTVSIPIERAIQILAQRGVPPSKPVTGNEYWPPSAASMLTGFEDKVEPLPR